MLDRSANLRRQHRAVEGSIRIYQHSLAPGQDDLGRAYQSQQNPPAVHIKQIKMRPGNRPHRIPRRELPIAVRQQFHHGRPYQ